MKTDTPETLIFPEKRTILPKAFYCSNDVLILAKALLGKVLVTHLDGHMTAGMIVETEAYKAPEDKASHAYGNRRTKRTETMFAEGGVAYIYLCYGIHHLFNVVVGPIDQAHAILIRGIQPVFGVEHMLRRRKMEHLKYSLGNGPGSLSQALYINRSVNGSILYDPLSPVRIEDWGFPVDQTQIKESPRVGVGYAAEWALMPWRYRIANNLWTSPAK